MWGAEMNVSVVIPHYKTAPFVAAAVESALAQTRGVTEVIVVDDGSPDDLVSALRCIDDPRLEVVRIPNGGASRARNHGVSISSGDVVAFLDADDVWYPTKIERQLALLARDDPPVAVGTQMHHIGARGPVGISGVAQIDDPQLQDVRDAELMPFPISSLALTRSVFDASGGFDETVSLVEDLDFVSRLARLGRIATVGEPLGGYRMRRDSGSAKHYRTQRHMARFLRARIAARAAGGDLTQPEFHDHRINSVAQWLDDTARALYRSAGILVADGRYVRASMHLSASAVLRPGYVIPRMRMQRVFSRRRGLER
jgi:glycosyltransferase involved in cell wall biosynthesis